MIRVYSPGRLCRIKHEKRTMIISQITRRLFTRLVLAEGVSLMGESGQDHGNHMPLFFFNALQKNVSGGEYKRQATKTLEKGLKGICIP